MDWSVMVYLGWKFILFLDEDDEDEIVDIDIESWP